MKNHNLECLMEEMKEDMVKVMNMTRRHDATINFLKDKILHMERGSKVRTCRRCLDHH